MSDMRRLIESMDSISKAAKKPTGPKFPGYWKGTDTAAQARDKMVGSSQESVIPELAKHAKEKTLEWHIEESYKQFKEQEYSGIDPVVRQRMGMQPATQGEIQSYLDKNPPGITTSTGQRVTSGSGAPVVSGGLTSVAKAADAASPDRAQSVARTPAATAATTPVQPTATPAPATTPEPANAVAGTATSEVPPGWTKRRPPAPPLPAPTTASTATAPAAPAAPAKPMPTMPQKVTAGSWQDIWKNNPNIKNPNLIYAGQEIKLPNGTSTIVDKGDTLSSIARRYRQGGYNVGTEVEPTPAAIKTSAVAPSSTAASAVAKPQPTVPTAAAKPQTQPQQNQTATPVKAPSTPTVKLGLGDPGYFPLIANKVEKRSDGKWYYPGNNSPVKPDVAKYAETQLARSAPSSKSSAATPKTDQEGLASYNTGRGKVYAADVNNPSGLGWDGKGKYTSYKTPEEGVNATKELVSRYLTNKTPYIKGSPTPEQVVSTWTSGGLEPGEQVQGGRYLQSVKDELAAAGVKLDSQGRIPYSKAATDAITRAIVRHETAPKHMEKFTPYLYPPKNEAVDKLAEQFAAFMEAQDPYGPEYQAMVQRVGQRAKQGPLKTVWDPVKRVYKNVPVKQEKSIKEFENAQDQDSQVTSPPSPDATASSKQFVTDKELQNMNAQKTLEADAGAQDPNKQTTSPPSPAAVAKAATTPAAPDVSVATAKTTMAGLKPALGPGVDTNAAATGVTKANLGQQLNPAEQEAVSALTPLVMKAATIPSAAPQLRSALTNAGTMAKAAAAKQGKM